MEQSAAHDLLSGTLVIEKVRMFCSFNCFKFNLSQTNTQLGREGLNSLYTYPTVLRYFDGIGIKICPSEIEYLWEHFLPCDLSQKWSM